MNFLFQVQSYVRPSDKELNIFKCILLLSLKVALKTPICTFDAKTGILCNLCESKLESGQITQSDVESSIVLARLAQKNSNINKITLISAKEIENEHILILKNSDIRLIRSNNDLSDILNKAFHKDIWIVESDSNDRRFLDNLFHPIKLETVNFVWLPDGSKLTRVVLEKNIKGVDEKRLKTIKKISMAVRQIDLIIEFD
jgi:transcription antitermination factor NusA-like protein